MAVPDMSFQGSIILPTLRSRKVSALANWILEMPIPISAQTRDQN